MSTANDNFSRRIAHAQHMTLVCIHLVSTASNGWARQLACMAYGRYYASMERDSSFDEYDQHRAAVLAGHGAAFLYRARSVELAFHEELHPNTMKRTHGTP